MTAPLGMIAGAGDFPLDLAERCKREGRPHIILRLAGFADGRLESFDGITLPIGSFGLAVKLLRRARCEQVIFCGKVWRPRWRDLGLDWGGFFAILRLLVGAWRHDDPLQRAIAAAFERRGIEVAGPAEIWPDLLAPLGLMTVREPTADEVKDVIAAVHAAIKVGWSDRGQGAVALDGAVLSVEDRDHTQGLLKRVAAMGGGGVLAKLAKPHQDRRLDLPVIGPETIRQAIEARLTGVVVEAGGAILTRRRETIALADKAGMFIAGVDPAQL